MKYILSFSRLIVGNLFIFSGLIKVNDPLGFSYKLEEYFVEFGMDWAWLHEILVPLAAALCIVEIILGVAVLVGYRMKEVTWSLLLMIIFFTILTGASAIFEIVRSCGCFGDAIPLTPWQSFYKDLILLALILVIFYKRSDIKPFDSISNDLIYLIISMALLIPLSIQLEWNTPFIFTLILLVIGIVVKQFKLSTQGVIPVLASLIISVFFSVYAVEHLPFKDYRPYAVDKNLPEQMTLPEGAQPPVYENVLTYKNTATGEEKEFNNAEYMASKIWEDKSWEWVSTESELIEEGDVAKITDFSVATHDGYDLTDDVLQANRVVMFICYDLSITSTNNLAKLVELGNAAASDGANVMVLSSAGKEQADKFIQDNSFDFDFYVTDGIVLKTMIRSNPGVIYMEKGTVKGKWHENDVPAYSVIQAL